MAAKTSKEHDTNAVASLVYSGYETEISELDRSGHVQQRWLHEPSGRIILVCDTTCYNRWWDVADMLWHRFVLQTAPMTSFQDPFANGAKSCPIHSSPLDSRTLCHQTTSHTRHLTLYKPSFPPLLRCSPTEPSLKVSAWEMPTRRRRLHFF